MPAAGAAEASDPEPSVLELPELKPPFRPAVVRPLLLGLLLLVLALEAEAERGDVLARYCSKSTLAWLHCRHADWAASSIASPSSPSTGISISSMPCCWPSCCCCWPSCCWACPGSCLPSLLCCCLSSSRMACTPMSATPGRASQRRRRNQGGRGWWSQASRATSSCSNGSGPPNAGPRKSTRSNADSMASSHRPGGCAPMSAAFLSSCANPAGGKLSRMPAACSNKVRSWVAWGAPTRASRFRPAALLMRLSIWLGCSPPAAPSCTAVRSRVFTTGVGM
mmetsp:Transcript_769/g.1926  ORF Transcript_769/g.1926 Transcript_769/m.1926 type:complete len:280 (-) Transcript_769:1435-2274(-)